MAFGYDDAAMIGLPLLYNWLTGAGKKNNAPGMVPGAGPYTKVLDGFGGYGGGGGSSSSSTSSTNYNKTSMPFILPEYAGLMAQLRKQMEARLSQGPLPAGFEETGLRKISDTYRGGEQAVQNQLIGRGLLGSPAEATAFAQQFALPRLGEMSNFRANIPLQARQFQNEDWSMLSALLDMFGKGQKESGSSTTRTNSSSRSGGGGGGGMSVMPGFEPGGAAYARPNNDPFAQLLPMLVNWFAQGGSGGSSNAATINRPVS